MANLLNFRKFWFTLLAVFAFIFGVGGYAFSQSESITITTYYPAPFGIYQNLRLFPTTTPPACDQNNEGVMYYNEDLHQAQLCQQLPDGTFGWTWIGGYWVRTDQSSEGRPNFFRLYPVNLDTNVIIGDTSGWTQARLEVVDNVSANHWPGDPGYSEGIALMRIYNPRTADAILDGIMSGLQIATGSGAGYVEWQLRTEDSGEFRLHGAPGSAMTVTKDGHVYFGSIPFRNNPNDCAYCKVDVFDNATTVISEPVSALRIRNPRAGSTSTLLLSTLNKEWQVRTHMDNSFMVHEGDSQVGAIRIIPRVTSTDLHSIRVGIGMTDAENPEATLHVNGSAIVDLGNTGGGQLIIGNNPNDNRVYLEGFSTDGTTSADAMLLTGRFDTDIPLLEFKATESRFSGPVFSAGAALVSDLSLKTNIQPIGGALGKIMQLKGISFEWKKDHIKAIGLTAQNVEKVFPEAVSTGQNGLKYLQYSNLVAPLIEAVKEQQAEIKGLKAEIEKLKSEVGKLKAK